MNRISIFSGVITKIREQKNKYQIIVETEGSYKENGEIKKVMQANYLDFWGKTLPPTMKVGYGGHFVCETRYNRVKSDEAVFKKTGEIFTYGVFSFNLLKVLTNQKLIGYIETNYEAWEGPDASDDTETPEDLSSLDDIFA